MDSVDFIKIDTDGDDYFVLRGATKTLSARGVLGVLVECPFHGSVSRNSCIFSNIDLLMREQGFSLFDLRPYRYSRAALPARFQYDIFAQTVSGQVQWCDALYFKEDPVTEDQRAKLATLYDAFDFPDCAAELISDPLVLDLLIQRNEYHCKTYEEYISAFKADPKLFLAGSRPRGSEWMSLRRIMPYVKAGLRQTSLFRKSRS